MCSNNFWKFLPANTCQHAIFIIFAGMLSWQTEKIFKKTNFKVGKRRKIWYFSRNGYFSTKNDRICTKTSDCGADRRRRRKKEGIIVCLRQSFKVENFIFSSDEGGPKEAPKDSPLAPWICLSQMPCQKFFDAFTSSPKSYHLEFELDYSKSKNGLTIFDFGNLKNWALFHPTLEYLNLNTQFKK